MSEVLMAAKHLFLNYPFLSMNLHDPNSLLILQIVINTWTACNIFPIRLLVVLLMFASTLVKHILNSSIKGITCQFE